MRIFEFYLPVEGRQVKILRCLFNNIDEDEDDDLDEESTQLLNIEESFDESKPTEMPLEVKIEVQEEDEDPGDFLFRQ